MKLFWAHPLKWGEIDYSSGEGEKQMKRDGCDFFDSSLKWGGGEGGGGVCNFKMSRETLFEFYPL